MQTMLPNVSNDSVEINDAHMPFACYCGIGDVGVRPCHQCMLSTSISGFASLVAIHVTWVEAGLITMIVEMVVKQCFVY
jgi:hypothetical protein